MTTLDFDRIRTYRAKTYRLLPGQQLKSPEEAVAFAKERGFIFFWPVNGVEMPSLWTAVAGNRPVADEHDDPGHRTWGWKDSLLDKRVWYYAKMLRKKATMIALEVAPYFYALSENYGSPEEDYLTLYKQGRLTVESKMLFEALLLKGPMHTIALRKEARLTSRDSESRFNKALTDLQANFQVLPVGIADAGAWHYSYIYDLTFRFYPDLQEQARFISERQARRKLVELYLISVGAAQVRDINRLFGWTNPDSERALSELENAGAFQGGLEVEGHPGVWWGSKDL
jgi:hypothetical protein